MSKAETAGENQSSKGLIFLNPEESAPHIKSGAAKLPAGALERARRAEKGVKT